MRYGRNEWVKGRLSNTPNGTAITSVNAGWGQRPRLDRVETLARDVEEEGEADRRKNERHGEVAAGEFAPLRRRRVVAQRRSGRYRRGRRDFDGGHTRSSRRFARASS